MDSSSNEGYGFLWGLSGNIPCTLLVKLEVWQPIYCSWCARCTSVRSKSYLRPRCTAFLMCWKVTYNMLIHSFKYVSCFRPFLQSNLVWLSKNHSSLYFWVDWPLYVLTFWKHISNGRPTLIGDKKPSAAWWTSKYWASC